MAQFPGITLTNAGLNMIAESQATSTALIFTKLKMGDGNLTVGEDIKTLTAVKNPMLTAAIQSYTNQGDGQVKLRFTISNGTLTTGFFAREIGIYAKVGAGGTEQLYAYTNAGNLTDYIPDKNTPIDEQIIDIYLVVGNASSVQIITDSSIMYVTMTDLNEHKSSGNAHPEIISAHNNDENAHPGLKTLVEKAGAMPIGAIMSFLMKSAPEGWLALDTGALVSRATYPDLWAWVQENAPLISETDWQTQASAQSSVGFFSTGDGSTTFRLPRILDYVRGGTLADVGTWQGDAIRNIVGTMKDVYSFADSISSASYSGALVGTKTYTASYNIAIGTFGDSSFDLSFDASRVVPTAEENRPKTIKMIYCIKAFGASTNQGLVDITALANEVAGKQKTIKYIQIQDEKPSGTAGGTFTAGAWRTRDLNTINHDDTGQVVVLNNQITLPAGTYEFAINAPCSEINGARARLQNITNGTTIGISKTIHANENFVLNSMCEVSGKFNISINSTLEVQHWGTRTVATRGLGFQSTVSGVNEIYTTAIFRKVE